MMNQKISLEKNLITEITGTGSSLESLMILTSSSHSMRFMKLYWVEYNAGRSACQETNEPASLLNFHIENPPSRDILILNF